MSAGWARVVRCRVGLVREDGHRTSGDHVGVLMGANADRRWLHSADVVGVEGGDLHRMPEVLDLLPGCRVVVGLGVEPLVRVRGVTGTVVLPDAESAGLVAALACSWPVEWGGGGAVVEAVRGAGLSALTCTEAGPTATVSVRLRGRTAVCRWQALY